MKTKIRWGAGLLALSGIAWTVGASTESGRSGAALPEVVRIAEMSVDRAGHQATLLENGEVLITGGCAGRGCDRVLASAELYDPATRSFRPIVPLTMPRTGHTATILPDGRVLVSGGWTGRRATASAEVYDPASSRWTAAGEMTEARVSHIAVPLTDGRVLVTGGQGAPGEILRSAEIFDPATGEFQPTGNMAVPRVKQAAALLADGRVLVLGRSDNRGYRERFASTEIYDPAAGEFSAGPEMRSARHKLRDAVVALPSGAVLVAAGATRPEILDPADQVFLRVEGELSGPQMFATATFLLTEEVLVTGGYDDRTQPSAGAWLVRPAN